MDGEEGSARKACGKEGVRRKRGREEEERRAFMYRHI
jgi:hypothetical protein